MSEKMSFDKCDKGCNVYVTVYCGDNERAPVVFKNDEKSDDDHRCGDMRPDNNRGDEIKYDWRKCQDKKCYPKPSHPKKEMKWPIFVTRAINESCDDDNHGDCREHK